jgi:hypothetical protein
MQIYDPLDDANGELCAMFEKSGYDSWGFKTLRTKSYLAWLKFSTMQAQRYIALQFEKQRKTSLVAICLPYTSMVECDALQNEILMSHSHFPPFSQMPFPRKHFRIRHSEPKRTLAPYFAIKKKNSKQGATSHLGFVEVCLLL